MTPEMKKKLAEAIGLKEVRIQNSGKVYYSTENWIGTNISIEFHPESNPAQREEVLLWLLGKGWVIQMDGADRVAFSKLTAGFVRDDSYTTALMMAAERELNDGNY